ncbi:hypothetical protein QFC24_003640 [Naganishia onofrii]|uniref:Uncharacterized protein n=1 Tax=Naganishia onofrii TaxID=1851511 RepID=A0ACC2XIP5_9TREE|nr:hypothetical protein QFC24_003640 [Naganishia onofrii]
MAESQPQDFPIPMKLSWNERRKMARYQKQVEKDERKRLKEQEREQRREEKEWDRQWRDYYKCVQ